MYICIILYNNIVIMNDLGVLVYQVITIKYKYIPIFFFDKSIDMYIIKYVYKITGLGQVWLSYAIGQARYYWFS